MFRTGNPTLTADAFTRGFAADTTAAMTFQGTVTKTAILLAIVFATAMVSWGMVESASKTVVTWVVAGAIGGFVLCLVTVFKKEWSPVTAPLYAFAEGIFLGAISAMYASLYHGIVLQAACLTFGTAFGMLMLYKLRIVQATQGFVTGVISATLGIGVVYLVSIIASMFGYHMPFIYGSGIIGIGFSLLVVVIAALNLVLDFAVIEQGVSSSAPKYMEWYGAFGLMVTLIWLYIEILRLLSKLRSR